MIEYNQTKINLSIKCSQTVHDWTGNHHLTSHRTCRMKTEDRFDGLCYQVGDVGAARVGDESEGDGED